MTDKKCIYNYIAVSTRRDKACLMVVMNVIQKDEALQYLLAFVAVAPNTTHETKLIHDDDDDDD